MDRRHWRSVAQRPQRFAAQSHRRRLGNNAVRPRIRLMGRQVKECSVDKQIGCAVFVGFVLALFVAWLLVASL